MKPLSTPWFILYGLVFVLLFVETLGDPIEGPITTTLT